MKRKKNRIVGIQIPTRNHSWTDPDASIGESVNQKLKPTGLSGRNSGRLDQKNKKILNLMSLSKFGLVAVLLIENAGKTVCEEKLCGNYGLTIHYHIT